MFTPCVFTSDKFLPHSLMYHFVLPLRLEQQVTKRNTPLPQIKLQI